MKAKIVQGDDFNLHINIKKKDNTSVILTGSQAIRFKLSGPYTLSGRVWVGCANNPALEKSLGDGITLGNSPASDMTVTLTHDDTNELSPGKYVFEIEITDAAGKISTARDFMEGLGELEVLADLDQ